MREERARTSEIPTLLPREATPPGGIPPRELVHNPARWKESLLTSWYVHQLVERGPSQQEGMYTSLLEGIPSNALLCTPACWKVVFIPAHQEEFPPGKLVQNPAHWEGFLRMSWDKYQLIGRDSFQQAGVHTLSLGGVPPKERAFIQARQEESLLASWYTVQLARRDSS
jgi:hypothetical protein